MARQLEALLTVVLQVLILIFHMFKMNWTAENQGNQKLQHREKSQIRLSFYPAFSTEKQQELLLAFKSRIPIKRVKTILIMLTFTDLRMPITLMIRNMEYAITEVVAEVQQEKQPIGLLVAQLPNN